MACRQGQGYPRLAGMHEDVVKNSCNTSSYCMLDSVALAAIQLCSYACMSITPFIYIYIYNIVSKHVKCVEVG